MPDEIDDLPADPPSGTSFGPPAVRAGKPSPWARALAGGLIMLTAVAFLWGGLSSAWRMWTGPSKGQLRIEFGILGLVLGFGLLARKRWARTATLLLCWVWFLGVPLLAMQSANPSIRVRYDLPGQLSHLAGPPAIVLVALLVVGMTLVTYVALMSRAGRSWYGLADSAGTPGPPLWLVPVALWLVVTATATVWLAGQRHIVPVTRLGGAVQALAVDGQYAYVAIGSGLGVLDLADPDRPVIVGQSTGLQQPHGQGFRPSDMVTTPGRAYVLRADGRTVDAFDTSDPRAPRAVGSVTLPFFPRDLHLANGRLYLVGQHPSETDSGGVVVLDVTGSMSPTIALQFDFDQAARAVAVDDEHWYVITGGPSRCAYCPADAAKSADPSTSVRVLAGGDLAWGNEEVGRMSLPNDARDLVLVGTRAYVTTQSGQLLVVDVAQPEQPTLRTTVDLTAVSPAVAAAGYGELMAAGDHLYTTDLGRSELVGIDISQPDQPGVDGRLTGVRLTNLAAGSGRLYALNAGLAELDDAPQVTAVDVTEPEQPRLSGGWVSVTPRRVLLTARADYVLSSDNGLYELDLAEPERPQLGKRVEPPVVVDAATNGIDVYVVDGDGSFRRLSTAGQAEASLRLPATGSDLPWRILAVTDGLAYLSDGQDTLQLVDVSDRVQFVASGAIELSGRPMAVAQANQRAYVLIAADMQPGIRYSSRDGAAVEQVLVYDVSSPAAPRRVGEITSWRPLSFDAAGLISDGRLFVGDSDGLQAYSLADPDHPVKTRTWSEQAVHSLVVGDDGLIARANTLRLYDLRPPFMGQEAGRMTDNWSGPIAARGDHVFTVDGELGLGVLRVDGLLTPLLRQRSQTALAGPAGNQRP